MLTMSARPSPSHLALSMSGQMAANTKIRQRAKNRIDVRLINEDSEGILGLMVGQEGSGEGKGGGGRRVVDPYESLRRTEHLDDLETPPPPTVIPLHFSLASIAAKCAQNETAHDDDGAGAAAAGGPARSHLNGGGGGGGGKKRVIRLEFRADPSVLLTASVVSGGAKALATLMDEYMTEPDPEPVPLDLGAWRAHLSLVFVPELASVWASRRVCMHIFLSVVPRGSKRVGV
jgi:hypothetical protein